MIARNFIRIIQCYILLFHGGTDPKTLIGQRYELREALVMYIKKGNLWADFEESIAYLDDDAMLVILDGWMGIFDVKEQHDGYFSATDFFMAAETAVTPAQTIMRELPERFRSWVGTLKPTTSNRPLKRMINTLSMFINFKLHGIS